MRLLAVCADDVKEWENSISSGIFPDDYILLLYYKKKYSENDRCQQLFHQHFKLLQLKEESDILQRVTCVYDEKEFENTEELNVFAMNAINKYYNICQKEFDKKCLRLIGPKMFKVYNKNTDRLKYLSHNITCKKTFFKDKWQKDNLSSRETIDINNTDLDLLDFFDDTDKNIEALSQEVNECENISDILNSGYTQEEQPKINKNDTKEINENIDDVAVITGSIQNNNVISNNTENFNDNSKDEVVDSGKDNISSDNKTTNMPNEQKDKFNAEVKLEKQKLEKQRKAAEDRIENCNENVKNAKAYVASELLLRFQIHFKRYFNCVLDSEQAYFAILLLSNCEELIDFINSWLTRYPKHSIKDININDYLIRNYFKKLKNEAIYYTNICAMLFEEDEWTD